MVHSIKYQLVVGYDFKGKLIRPRGQPDNSLFYRSATGARTGDTFMSLIHSADVNRQNY
jgi:hypothetical protein